MCGLIVVEHKTQQKATTTTLLQAFTLLEHPSLCLLYIMGCLFDTVVVTKPSPSKPGNSETYVVGKGTHPSQSAALLVAYVKQMA